MMKVVRGEIWSADLNPQTHRSEPAKSDRPVFVLQTDALNHAGHPTTIVIPGTSQTDGMAPADHYPLRVRVQKQGGLDYDTDLLIDQVRAIANARFKQRLAKLPSAQVKKVMDALRELIA